jgi:hypothetical protein
MSALEYTNNSMENGRGVRTVLKNDTDVIFNDAKGSDLSPTSRGLGSVFSSYEGREVRQGRDIPFVD